MYRRRLFRILAVLGGIAVALGIGELATFLSGVNNPYRAFPTGQIIPHADGPFEMAVFGHVPRATLRVVFATNPRGYFDGGDGIDHLFNSVGWRDDEHTIEKPPNTFRILALGDSYLFGMGVRREDICLSRLRESLARRLPDRTVETINTGQPGYNTAMELQLLSERGLAYDPDLVILHFVPNDVEPDIYTEKPKVEFLTEFVQSYVTNDWLSQHSELWSLVRRRCLYHAAGRDYVQQSLASYAIDSAKWNGCRRALDEIHSICRSREIPLLIVVFPFFHQLSSDYPFAPIHEHVNGYCQSEEIDVLDLRHAFREFAGPELWVHPTDQHPNEIAHRVAADAMADYLWEHRTTFHLE